MNYPQYPGELQAAHCCTDFPDLSAVFLLKILNGISDSVFVKDRQHRWVFLNDTACGLTGYSREELIGKSEYNFFPKTEADVFWENDELVFSTGITDENEEIFTDATGITHVISTKKSLFVDEQGNQFLVGITRNITQSVSKYRKLTAELHESKQLLQLAMDNIPHKIFWKDRRSVYLGCNSEFARIAGLDSPADIIGKSDYDLPWKKAESDRFRECDRQVMDSGEALLNIVETQRQANGKATWAKTNKIPLRDVENKVIGILGTYEDITPFKETQQALEHAYAQMGTLVLERTQQLAKANEALQTKINELEEVEIALRKSEARIQKLAASIPGMLYEFALRPDGSMFFPYVSPGSYEIYELTPEQIQTDVNFVFSCTHPEEAESFYNSIALSAQTLEPWLWEGRTILPSKELKWIKGASRPEKQADGSIVWYGVVLDVTSRKQAEAALKKSESQYRNLVETIKDVIWSTDESGNITFVNQAVRDFYGYEPEEMIGKNFIEFLLPEQVKIDLQVFQNCLYEQSIIEYETVHLRKNGEPLNLLVSSTTLEDEAGNIIGRTGTSVNITERKKAEKEQARLVAILESTSDYVGIASTEQYLTYLNTSGRKMLGIGENEDINKIHIRDIFPSHTFVKVAENMTKFLQQGIWKRESEMLHRDGREIPVSQVFMAHKSATGELEYTSLIARDISEIKLKEAQLAKQAQELQQALSQLQRTQIQLVQSEKMSSLGQLVAGIAHEINNPTSFIYGNLTHTAEYFDDLIGLLHLYQTSYPQPTEDITRFTNNIELDFLESDLPKLLNSMKFGAERIKNIVVSLRNFSRLDETEMKAVNIHEGLESTLMILQNRLKTQDKRPEIKVIKKYNDLPLVECWAGELNQVFLNILANAVDALEETFVNSLKRKKEEITISITTEITLDSKVKISILDNGAGIPKNVKQQIFDPFFTTKPIGQGTGMGLAICYQIITEKHHGSLECFSTPGEGTEFVITIPLVQ